MSALPDEQQRKEQGLTATSARLPSVGPGSSVATACGHRLWDWLFHIARASSRLTAHETVWEFRSSPPLTQTQVDVSHKFALHSSPVSSSSSVSAHLGWTAARTSRRLDFSDPEIPGKTSVIWSAQWGFVRMSAGLQISDTFLKVKRGISDCILNPKILNSYALCLAKPAPRRNRLGGRRNDPQLHFQVCPQIDRQKLEPQTISYRLDQSDVLLVLFQPRRQHPSTTSTPPLVDFCEDLYPAQSESEQTCTTSELKSRPDGYSQRKSGYCKRYWATLLSRTHDDCFGAAISRQASFAANWTSNAPKRDPMPSHRNLTLLVWFVCQGALLHPEDPVEEQSVSCGTGPRIPFILTGYHPSIAASTSFKHFSGPTIVKSSPVVPAFP